MDVVFVVGLAIELARAALLAAGQVTLDVSTIARRGILFPQSEQPRREAQRESARATVGFALLVLGVATAFG